ncbi:prealbumin-like fold domain-containing protein [Acinetobacter tandoii]|uniref:prealbumin-like fold domain-containing protein n=1 Tax=Acinetobacter tandoii TaxID=202954 RepID=UPI004046557E
MWGTKMKCIQKKIMLSVALSTIGIPLTHALTPLSDNPIPIARFEVISANTPTIVQGDVGTQTITIKNFGPSAATATKVEVRAALTTGVSISQVRTASNTCTLANSIYTCSIGSVANAGTFDIYVDYSVASTAPISSATQQTTVAISSNEVNPGSGVGESIHRVWGQPGSTQLTNPQPYDAFWAGRNTSQTICSGSTCGTYAEETSAILGAWPASDKNPIGQYLSASAPSSNSGDSYYTNLATSPNPTFVEAVTNLTTYQYRSVLLPTVSATNSRVNNLRAWEFETYVYIPASTSSMSACVGNSGAEVDDGAYISITPPSGTVAVIQTPRDSYQSGIRYEVSTTISTGGYYKVNYRMLNQNTSNKYSQGQYGPIGMSFSGGTCSNTELQRLTETGFGTAITVAKRSDDLAISKTVDKTVVQVGDVVTYTLKVWNQGEKAISNITVADLIPDNLAGLYRYCVPSSASVTCPTVSNPEDSNQLSAIINTLPVDKTGNTNFLSFIISGLVYKEPVSSSQITNTATVNSTEAKEIDLTNNTSAVSTTVSKSTPITSGSSQNQCLSGQSANLVSDTSFRAYSVDNASSPYDNALKTAGTNPTIVPNSVMYGTGANGALQLKGRLNWSNGSPKANTSGATLKIIVDGIVYATLVTPAKSSNTRASFTAFNGAQVDTADYAIGSYGTDPGAINFTITLPTTVTMAKIVRTEFQNVRPNTSTYVGDDIGIGFNELNVCLKPTFEINKVSENGTDTFNFSTFTNLSNANAETITSGEVVTTVIGTAQPVRLKTSTSPVEQGSMLAYATPNTAISFTESASTLYSLKSIECTDTNAAVSGNSAANLGGVNGLTQTIPAANVKFAAKLVCRVTNSKKAGYVFSGRVFNDNSGTTSDISKAYNAIVDAGELGIAGSTVELRDCSTKAVLAATTSNSNGDFKIQTLDDVFAGRSNVCLVQRNLTGFDSVSSAKASGVTATADTGNDFFTIPKAANVTSYEGFLFGDAELQLVLTQNGQKTIVAGDVVDYPHELSAKSVMNVLNLTETKEQQPANNQPWQSLVYVDSNCNAQLDQGESLLSSRVLKANEKICLIQRVNSPTTAQGGDRFIASFKVNGKATYSTATTKESNSVNDITTIGTAGLNMSKLVRKTSACPAPSNDSTPFTVTNQAAKGDYLEYQITYTNNSNKNLVDIVLKDSVPLGTVYGTMSCSASGCQTQESLGQLKWTIPGVLAPKQKGQVGFCVRIPN